jgi:hypothetical protein
MRNYRVYLAGGAGILLVALSVTAGPAVAQAMQATLTRNADEPGRNPYQSTVIFNAIAPNGLLVNPCTAGQCVAAFTRVPEGKRLALCNITGFVRGNVQFLSLVHEPGNNPQLTVLPLRELASGAPFYSFNETIGGYVEGGHAPLFSAFGSGAFLGNRGSYSQVKLSGYLVDLSQ